MLPALARGAGPDPEGGGHGLQLLLGAAGPHVVRRVGGADDVLEQVLVAGAGAGASAGPGRPRARTGAAAHGLESLLPLMVYLDSWLVDMKGAKPGVLLYLCDGVHGVCACAEGGHYLILLLEVKFVCLLQSVGEVASEYVLHLQTNFNGN